MKQFQLLFVACLLLISINSHAQKFPKTPNKTNANGQKQGQWTILYNADWEITQNASKVEFYRTVAYKNNKPVGKVKGYYKNGNLQMMADSLVSENPEVFVGKVVYYRTNGSKQKLQVFAKGEIVEEKLYDHNGEQTEDNYESLSKKGDAFYKKGKHTEAIALFEKAKIQAEKEFGKEHPDYASSCNNLAEIYNNQGLYAKSEPLFIEAKNIFEKVLGKEHPDYATSCNNIASLYKNQGLYAKAELLSIESKNIREKILGKEHPDYASSCNNLALLYNSQGLYNNAEPLYKEAKNINEKTFGKEHPNYAISCDNLAALYLYQGLYDKAEPLFMEAKNIREKVLGKEHPDYATSCNNMASLYRNQGLYAKAELLSIESKNIREKTLGKEHPNYALSCNNLANLYYNQGLYAKAEPLYIESKNIREKLFGRGHHYYASSCNNLADVYKATNNFIAAEPLYAEVFTNKTKQINTLLPTLSEKERIAYLKSLDFFFSSFQDFTLAYRKQKPKIIADLYNQILLTKGLVFSSTQKMRKQILNSGDTSLISDFENWKKQKNNYNKLQEKGIKHIQKNSLNIDSLAAQINELEKNLSKRSTLFAQNVQVKSYQWQQVQAKLGKNEAVVEIIRTLRTISRDSLGKILKDTVYIALFVTHKTQNQPEMLVLENGKDLENKHLKFYKNAIQFKTDDENSYKQYWQPIAEKLKRLNKRGFAKIYFSPDGVYHQISLNTLQNPDNQKFVLDEQTIQLIGTSRDLIELGNNEADLTRNFQENKAYLLGFPSYNLEGDNKSVESKERSFSVIQRVAGQRVSVLPGTKTEIGDIAQHFKQKNMATQVFMEAQASEENMKNLVSPAILHIATHGFFVPPPKGKEVKTMEEATRNKALENPFMRSGLLLAGCENPKSEGEDGVLTAEEAMNLHLENTELVVLSACETGLGDVQNGEGVFGLQRAFQQAGAKTILMSLWKVSDEATQLLMSEFYTALLSGKPKREAFKTAQLKLRQRYESPYYWGAFVMVGE